MSQQLPDKPLGTKAYGRILHLPGSFRGPDDHSCTEDHARIATQQPRDRYDTIVVQEKLDGSCVAVARLRGNLIPLGRAGYPAITSKYEQHHYFADWVFANASRFEKVLKDGERLCGEWLMQAHGTRYRLPHEPFVAFDIMRGSSRLPFPAFRARVNGYFPQPHLIHLGGPLAVEEAFRRLGEFGFHGAIDRVEGAVWRVERECRVDFVVKYVRPDKNEGCYLPEVSGQQTVWNRRAAGKKSPDERFSASGLLV